jgi:SAM-dependent methyltransferase
VVANNAMNRERGLSGVNSYTKELGFDPYEFLVGMASQDGGAARKPAWLDVCCGSGWALIQAAGRFAAEHPEAAIEIVGVDLVDYFRPGRRPPGLTLVAASIAEWRPRRAFDLISCVHGLHYVGDKLGFLAQAASWLAPDGLLIADLDAEDIRHDDGRSAGRQVTTALKAAGFDYDARRHQVRIRGPRTVRFPARYLGADDTAGPGYTGQPAVDSYYAWGSPNASTESREP